MSASIAELPTAEPTTATSPAGRAIWRSIRGPIVVAALLLVVALAAALVAGRQPSGTLDPDATDGSGSHALATLLRGQDVDVSKVGTVDEALGGADSDTTVLVTFPARLSSDELATLTTSQADLVVISPDKTALAALDLPVDVSGPVSVRTVQPRCALPAAQVAGAVKLGGYRYRVSAANAVTCYEVRGLPTVVHLRHRNQDMTLIGTGAPWTNDRLDQEGNAALGLSLLGAHAHLRWLVPDLSLAASASGERSLLDLLPTWVPLGAAQLAIAAVLIALWRARRLGPVIAEPLPVVVRAAETVEGRATLYRSAHARSRAGDALREGCRRRLATALGLPAEADRAALITSVSERTGRPAPAVESLLYGAALDDDGALVRLANELDILDREVRHP